MTKSKKMGRGPVIERKRNLTNAAKQKIFTIHAKLIAIAAQKGGDPALNPNLQDAIDKAKKDNVPNDNIERAIKKGTGEDKSSSEIVQINYEGYGAGGVAFIVSTLTDNKNRTASDIRHIFSKNSGNMGEPGSVSFVFEKKGILVISLESQKKEELEELVFETEAEDFFIEDSMFKIITSLEDFVKVKNFFLDKNINFEFDDLGYIPSNTIKIEDFDIALKITKMIEDFNECEDSEKIYSNMEISEELQQKVDEFIEKNKFRT